MIISFVIGTEIPRKSTTTLKDGGSFWMVINLYKNCWFVNQPTKNDGWTSRELVSGSIYFFGRLKPLPSPKPFG